MSTGGTGGGATALNLYFSEYVEGSGSENKALELYNAGSTWDLSTCILRLYSNGNPAANTISTLSGVVTAGATYTICRNDLTNDRRCDLSNVAAVNFTGNDVVELVCDDELQDSIGQVGFAPPDLAWIANGVSTMNQTLRRRCEVTQGDRDSSDVYDPSVEWAGFAQNDYDDFGSYTCVPSTPHPGQVVITGMRRGAPVEIAFSVLTELGAGTELKFTDNPWNGAALKFGGGEDGLSIRFPNAVPPGTTFVWSTDTGLSPALGNVSGGLRDFGQGDQVLLFQDTAEGPSFIFGASCSEQAPGFVAQALGAGHSELPDRLASPWDAYVDLASNGQTGCVYVGDRQGQLSFVAYQRLVADPANWSPTTNSVLGSDFRKP